MFDLKELPDSVLDCCAGGAGFTAEAAARGVDAIAADPAYELDHPELVDSVRKSLPATSGIVDEHHGSFVWHWYGRTSTGSRPPTGSCRTSRRRRSGTSPPGCRSCRSVTAGSSWCCARTC